MKVLLTGASSFTGAWFATTLRAGGHDVVATLRGAAASYTEGRGRRVQLLRDGGIPLVEHCSFGDSRFMALLREGFDIICHHGAQVGNYKSLDFDVLGAVRENAQNVSQVLQLASQEGVRGLVLTGSVFEQDEGLGPEPRRAFSPYGLSKGLTWEVFRYWGDQLKWPVHKFVIGNPFGPYEEPRFCAYLMKQWSKGEAAMVSTPNYIRDNIHVSLLAASYVAFIEQAVRSQKGLHCGPSGYIESQGQFSRRFASEVGRRLGLRAELTFAEQREFSEPELRVNVDRPALNSLGWSEAEAWDALAIYYRSIYLVE